MFVCNECITLNVMNLGGTTELFFVPDILIDIRDYFLFQEVVTMQILAKRWRMRPTISNDLTIKNQTNITLIYEEYLS